MLTLVDGVEVVERVADERVPRLVHGDALAHVARAPRAVAREPEGDALERARDVVGGEHGVVPAERADRRLVEQVLELRAAHPRRGARDDVEVHVVRERLAARVDAEDVRALARVGERDGDAPVEAARAQERLVEHVGAVGRGEHDAAIAVEAVHRGEEFVERGLALLVAPPPRDPDVERWRATASISSIQTMHGASSVARASARAHARGADADVHLHERGRGDARKAAFASPATARARNKSCPCRAVPRGGRRAERARRSARSAPDRGATPPPRRAPPWRTPCPPRPRRSRRGPRGRRRRTSSRRPGSCARAWAASTSRRDRGE